MSLVMSVLCFCTIIIDGTYYDLFHSDCFYIVHACSILRCQGFTREYTGGVWSMMGLSMSTTTATQYKPSGRYMCYCTMEFQHGHNYMYFIL